MKRVLIASLVILVLFPISVIIGDDSDTSRGDFLAGSPGNDPPSFVSWFETAELITPSQDVDFTAEVYDLDNGSSELTVTLYYTFSIFSSENLSVVMSFDVPTAPFTNNYTYTFPGQPHGTVINYYYQAFDGETTVQEGVPTYFELLWSFPPVTVERPIPADVVPEILLELPEGYLLIFFFGLFIITATIYLFMNKAKKQVSYNR